MCACVRGRVCMFVSVCEICLYAHVFVSVCVSCVHMYVRVCSSAWACSRVIVHVKVASDSYQLGHKAMRTLIM